MKTWNKILIVGTLALGSTGGLALAHGHGGWHGGGWHGGYSRVIIAPPPVYAYSPYTFPRYGYYPSYGYGYPYYGSYGGGVVIVRGGGHRHHHHHHH